MRTTAVRAPEMQAAERELMEAGAGYFDLGRYDEAARRFRAALQRDPELAEAAYALGLSLALSGDARGAIAPLESATRLATGELLEQARWVLANAHLKSGHIAAARAELERLGAASGEHGARARELTARLGP
jgi:tetratricopeptide (TPR) repeat protein